MLVKRLDENIRILQKWIIYFARKLKLKFMEFSMILYQIYKLLHGHDFFRNKGEIEEKSNEEQRGRDEEKKVCK
jgi:hypothetical protein